MKRNTATTLVGCLSPLLTLMLPPKATGVTTTTTSQQQAAHIQASPRSAHYLPGLLLQLAGWFQQLHHHGHMVVQKQELLEGRRTNQFPWIWTGGQNPGIL